MASVTVRDVRKAYGPVQVIHGVNIDIHDGELLPTLEHRQTICRLIREESQHQRPEVHPQRNRTDARSHSNQRKGIA